VLTHGLRQAHVWLIFDVRQNRMPKSPDQIYDEVEARWTAQADERKRERWRRIGEVSLLSGLCVALFAFGIIEGRPLLGSLSIPFFTFAFAQLQKGWQLEARVKELERRQ